MKVYPRYVYLIRHKSTQKVYVGSSANPEKRYSTHVYNLKTGKHPVEDFQQDYDKDDGLEYEVVDTIKTEQEDIKEYEWMEKLGSRNRETGYNYKDRHYKPKCSYASSNQGKNIVPGDTEMATSLYRRSLISDIVMEVANPHASERTVALCLAILRKDRLHREGKLTFD